MDTSYIYNNLFKLYQDKILKLLLHIINNMHYLKLYFYV